MELCAIAVLKSSVHQSPLPGAATISRCDCDFYHTEYKSKCTTKEFISQLPVPSAIKEFFTVVAKDLCQDMDLLNQNKRYLDFEELQAKRMKRKY